MIKYKPFKNYIYRRLGKTFIVENVGNPGRSAFRIVLAVSGPTAFYGLDWGITHGIVNPTIVQEHQQYMLQTEGIRGGLKQIQDLQCSRLDQLTRDLSQLTPGSPEYFKLLSESSKESTLLNGTRDEIVKLTPELRIYKGDETIITGKILETLSNFDITLGQSVFYIN